MDVKLYYLAVGVTGHGKFLDITTHPVSEETWDSRILPHSLCQRTLGIIQYHQTAYPRRHNGFSYITTQPVSEGMGDFAMLCYTTQPVS